MEAENIQARIVENCPDTTAGRFWPKCFWPPSSPDLNVMDFVMWGILTMKACEKPHANVKSLKLKKARAADLDEETIRNFCGNSQKISEAVVEAVFEILKSHFNKNDAQNICYLQFVFKIGIP